MALKTGNCLVLSLVFLRLIIAVKGQEDPLCAGYPEDQEIVFPYPLDCERYYKCVNGILTEERCEEGTYFSETNQGCFPEDYSECVGGTGTITRDTTSSTQPYTTSAATTTKVPATTTPPPTTTTVAPTTTTPAPTTTTPAPTTTTTPAPTTTTTPPTTTTTPPTTATPTTPAPSEPTPDVTTENPLDPRCSDNETNFWPHPSECHRYIECYEGNSYDMICPPGKYFSDEQKLCVEAGESECCTKHETQCQ